VAKRTVDLLINAKDSTSQVAKNVTSALKQMRGELTGSAEAAAAAGSPLDSLVQTLNRLKQTQSNLSSFRSLASDMDRLSSAIGQMKGELAGSQQAFGTAAQKANAEAKALQEVKDKADAAAKALSNAKTKLQELSNAKPAAQSAANVSTLAGTISGKTSLGDADAAKLSAINAAIKEQQTIIRSTERDIAAYAKQINTTTANVARADAEVEKFSVQINKQAADIQKASGALSILKAEAKDVGTSLGGVAATEAEIAAESARTATAITQVTAALKAQRAAQSGAGTGIEKQTLSATNALRQQISAVDAAKAAWKSAEDEAARLATAIRGIANPTEELKAQTALAVVAAQNAKKSYQDQVATLGNLRTSIRANIDARKEQIATDQRAAAAAQAQAQTSARLVELQAAAAIRSKAAVDAYNKSLVGMIRNFVGLKSPAEQAAAAINKATTAAIAGQGKGISKEAQFQRTQNLAFQLNDIATQLASGTSLTRTLGQQAGQIAQLSPTFNKVLVSLLSIRGLLIGGGLAALFAPLISAMLRLKDAADNAKTFELSLITAGRQADATGQQLAGIAQRLDDVGGSMKDAVASEKEFLSAGIAVDHFEQLGIAAQNLARATGIEVPEAAAKLATALSGGAAEVTALDKQLNFLTASERAQIAVLDENTDATTRLSREAEIRKIAEAAILRQNDEIAAKSRGPWGDALRSLTGLWAELTRTIADTGALQAIGGFFDELAGKIKNSADQMRLFIATLRNGGNQAKALAEIQGQDKARAGGDPLDANSPAGIRAAEEKAKKERLFAREVERSNKARQFEIEISKKSKADQAGLRAGMDLVNKARAEGVVLSLDQINKTIALAKAEELAKQGSRDRISDGKKAENAQRTFNAELQKTIDLRFKEAALVGKPEREKAVQGAVDQATERAQQKGLQLSKAQEEAVRKSAETLFDANEAESFRNTILQQQIELRRLQRQETTVDDQIHNEALLANIDRTTKAGKAWEEARRPVIQMNNDLDALNKKQDELAATIAKIRDGERDIKTARQDGETQKQLAERRAALDAESIKAKQLQAEIITAGETLGPAFQDVVDKAKAANVEIRIMRDEVLSTAQANNMLAEGLTGATLGAADAIGAAIEGTKSWGEALGDVGTAFQQFAADFLRQIAQMIIQALILRAIQSSGAGGFISGIANGLGIGGKHNGGILGRTTDQRVHGVNPAVFANAARFHGGGMVGGLKPNEVPIIAQKGEEVLTADNPRHAANGGGAKGDVKIVNAIDSGSFVSAGLSTKTGQAAIMNFITANRQQINGALQ